SGDGLSQRQERILGYIQDFILKRGYSPAIRDIQNDLKISSTSVVAYNLRALEEKGKIIRDDKISRGISMPGMSPSVLHVPLLGVITAGSPLPDPEDISSESAEKVEVPLETFPADKLRDVYA